MDFHGPNIDLNFHVDWFGSFRTSLCATGDRHADKQTDGQTGRQKQTDIVIA